MTTSPSDIPEAAVEAAQAYFRQIHEVSEALRMIGEAFGHLTIPDDSRFLAHKLVTSFNIHVEGCANESL